MLRAAVLGCGMIAGYFESPEASSVYSHGKAYARMGLFSDLGFYDVVPEKAQVVANKFGGKSFESQQALLEEFRPDVVSICTPDTTHFPILKQILKNPGSVKLVFAEKPICQTRAELEQLLKLQSTSGVQVVVNHSRRFDPAHQELKKLCASGELGALVRADIDYYGGWLHLGVHAVDLLHFLFGTDVRIESAHYSCPSRYADDPTLDVTGFVGSAPLRFSGFDETHYQILEFDLKFERGMIKINDFGSEISVFKRIVNAEQERVLVRDPELSYQGMQAPILHAVGLIANYLQNQDSALLEDYGLKQASITMNTLWQGCSVYEQNT